MESWPPQVWAAIVGTVGLLVTAVSKRAPSRADAAATLTGGALQLVNELQEELAVMRRRMTTLEDQQETERETCDARINQLVQALHAAGIDIPPPPAPKGAG